MKKTWKLSSKYNFDKILVGERVRLIVPADRLRSAATMYGKRNGVKFETAKDGNAVLIWRVQ